MFKIEVDEEKLRELYLEKLDEKIKKIDAELVFWDASELKRRVCMSWNTIQKEFFFDPSFPKFKVGSKWYFPADETKEFLLKWLKNQKRY